MTPICSLKHLALGTGLAVAALTQAAPVMATQFQWDPAAAVSGADALFTATNITVQDYAAINVASSGAFTETGLINLSSFSNGGTPVTLPSLGNTYALYAAFSGSGTQASGNVTPAPGTTVDGTFNTLSYTLFAAAGKPTFGANAGGGTVSGLSNPVTLATGSLISGTTALTNGGSGLSATATTVNTLNVVDPLFFASPDSTFTLDLNVAFTNTGSVLSVPDPSTLVVNGGGGNATLSATGPTPPVPEPASFAILGAGLLCFGLIRRRKLS